MAAVRMVMEIRYEGKESTTLEFDEERLVLGRVDGKVKLSDPQVSSAHLALFEKDGSLWADDLGSRNGTRLNDEPLVPGKPREIHSGDTLSLGSYTTITLLKAAAVRPGATEPPASIIETAKHDTPRSMPRFDLVGGSVDPVPKAADDAAAAEGVWAAQKDSIPPKASEGFSIPEGSLGGALAILKEAYLLYRANVLLFLAIAAVLYVPAALISGCSHSVFFSPVRQAEESAAKLNDIAKKMGQSGSFRDSQSAARSLVEIQAETLRSTGAVMSNFLATVLQLLVTMIVVLFVFGLAQPITQGAMIYAVAARKKHRKITWHEAWMKVLPSIVPLVLTSLLVGFFVGVGTLFLIVPGVIVGFLCAFVSPVVILEKLQFLAAIKRSVQLVASDWLRVAVVLIVLLAMNYASGLLTGLVFSNFTFAYGFSNTILSMLVIPFPVVAGVLLYFDLRLKRDKVDCLETL